MSEHYSPVVAGMLEKIAGLKSTPDGAYNFRLDGKGEERKSSDHIKITQKTDKPGIDIHIADGTVNEKTFIPVVITKSGIEDLVYNDFFIGENCDVTIIAGCGIHNCGCDDSVHEGIHRFFLGKNSKVVYIEKHIGEGDGSGKRIINPQTHVEAEENAYIEMDTVQLKGVDSTKRVSSAKLGPGATIVIKEKIMTHGHQTAETSFDVSLDGAGSSAKLISRSVARDFSRQLFRSKIIGNTDCYGHSECDAIIMDNGVVAAEPEIIANHVDASLVHEAAIGKIAGDQLVKLMTLGLTEKEAEAQIINGFLK